MVQVSNLILEPLKSYYSRIIYVGIYLYLVATELEYSFDCTQGLWENQRDKSQATP